MGFKALIGFVPFAAFALLEKLAGMVAGLEAGTLVSLILVVWTAIRQRRIDVLETGSALIFGVLTWLALYRAESWSVWEVRIYVDGGLALVILISVLLRRPFTLQRGPRPGSDAPAASSGSLRDHDVLSGAWALAFAGLAVVDIYMSTHPESPDRRGIVFTLLVLAAAVKFTQWRLKRMRSPT